MKNEMKIAVIALFTLFAITLTVEIIRESSEWYLSLFYLSIALGIIIYYKLKK